MIDPLMPKLPRIFLDDRVTPASRLFIRNNGIQPNQETVDPDKWVLTITGESVC